MKYITYTPELESFEAKNFKTDKDYLNLVRNMSTYAYDKDDKKFMKNFAGQFSYKPINTNSVKEFVASLWASKILMKGDLTNRTLSADDKRIPATAKPKSDRKKSSPAKKGVSKKSKGISGSLYQKFQEVAKKTNFNLRGASLPAFLKWMNANAKELFGKSIATKKWFTLLDEYPQIMDAMASAQIDTELLEDEDEKKVERYYAKVKK
jgi:oligoribonuclease (3'-5' exoribonuclease)